ncbi:MAG: hypothetical protein Q4G36_10630 [Paracoccus sp. (in: a-proteobacteria)]|nr:hypothetical protein [Paracoccus sp. (in: a-proteobacteria)]
MTSDKNETPTGMTEDAPRAAETGGTIQSREVAAGDGAPAASDSKPMIDSALVGQSDDPLPAAAPKDAEPKGDAPFESEEDYHELPRVPKASPFAAEDETVREDEGMAAEPPAPAAMAPVTPAPQVIEKRTGFWPVALGGVVAAALGSAATIWALPHLPAAWLPTQETFAQEPAPQVDGDAIRADAVSAATDAAREAATETARAEVQAGLEAQADTIRQSAEDAARAVLAELPESGADTPEELQAALTAQNQRIEEMETRIADLAAAPAPQPEQQPVAEPAQPAEAQASAEPAADLSAFEDRIAALQSQLDEQQSRIEDLQARPEIDSAQFDELRSMAEEAAQTRDRIEAAASEAQQTLESVQADAAAASERAQAVASFAALRAALETGGDRAAAASDLAEAGVTVPEALSAADIPTLDELQAGFDPAARAALRASLQSGADDSSANAVTRFLRVQTGARSVTPREGGDADAVLSRAGAAVQAGQIEAALSELAALSQPGQEAMAGWTAQARAWLDAQAALDDVATSLN